MAVCNAKYLFPAWFDCIFGFQVPMSKFPILRLGNFEAFDWCSSNNKSGLPITDFESEFIPFAEGKMLKNLLRSGRGYLIFNAPMTRKTPDKMKTVWPVVASM